MKHACDALNGFTREAAVCCASPVAAAVAMTEEPWKEQRNAARAQPQVFTSIGRHAGDLYSPPSETMSPSQGSQERILVVNV